ncbi:hypothetical protein [Egbenema bharatensis]
MRFDRFQTLEIVQKPSLTPIVTPIVSSRIQYGEVQEKMGQRSSLETG